MGFFNWLRRLFEWFLKIWNSLDDETKRKIIDEIIKAFASSNLFSSIIFYEVKFMSIPLMEQKFFYKIFKLYYEVINSLVN